MAFTRIRNDTARLEKEVEQSVFAGHYHLDVPGPGIYANYIADPQIRLTQWGANMWSDSTNLESELRGLGRPLNHDYDLAYNSPQVQLSRGTQIAFPTNATTRVDESRATHPAWMYRDLEHRRWETPFINPLANTEKPFTDNMNTRILAKDEYRPKLPRNM